MGESSGSSNQMTLAIETQPNPISYLPPICVDPSGRSMEQASNVNSIEKTIEESKSHWSQLGDFESKNEEVEVSNMELFKTLQSHPTWGGFFITFGKGKNSCGELVMGEKIAEGGQAEIYDVQVKWYNAKWREVDRKHTIEHVLKVFKKGTFLRQLQSQWPQGMLQHHANKRRANKRGLSSGYRFTCDVLCGTLLEDGRFAFLMLKEEKDLRKMINNRMMTRSNDEGPFSKREALKTMYEVALGMNQLHDRGIVHRDIKASNVLVSHGCIWTYHIHWSWNRFLYMADFECSVGVVGTGFFRAPEILEACKHGNEDTKEELFTKATDIYSYGMTCYEILTGKLPFEGHLWSDYDLVFQGQRPKVPNYVDGWVQQLLNSCWQSNPIDRPTSQEILKILEANSVTCWIRGVDFHLFKVRQRYERAVRYRLSKIAETCRLLQLKLSLPN